MSAFAGVYYFDGRPVDRELVSAMGQAIARKGPDGGSDWCAGSVGMSYRAFHTTHESHFERQPMAGARGVMLCWDGRLDNREELQEWLGSEAPLTDAGLALAAYGRWGEEFAGRLVGDFALALYDPGERQVLLARDFFGPRPLYYCRRDDTLMWGTDLLPLLECGGVDAALDEHYIAQYLLMSVEPHRTPYLAIRSVEPGHVMAFRQGRVRTDAWHWKPDPKKEIRYRTDREYEEHFYDVFRRSVKARLRSDARPIWADLSGGLDSSSIVGMADALLAEAEASCPRLDTWTAVNGDSIMTNELPFARAVEERRGQVGFHLREDPLWFKDIAHFDEPVLVPTGMLCIPNRYRILQREMDQAGARVLLSGHGGDHLLWKVSEPSPELADLFRRGKWVELHRQVRIWSSAKKMPYWKALWRYSLMRAAPEGLTRSTNPERRVLRYLTSQRLAAGYRREPLVAPDPFGFGSITGRLQSGMLQSAIRYVAPELFPECFRVEVRHPFLARPLVEYVFAIPHSQKHRPGQSRSLMRRAFRELLPSKVLQRDSKGSVDEAICRGLHAAWDQVMTVLEQTRPPERDLVNRSLLVSAANDVMHGGKTPRGDLLRLIALEVFLGAAPGSKVSGRLEGEAWKEPLTVR